MPLRVGIIGTGPQAAMRAQLIRAMAAVPFVGYFDTDPDETVPALDVFLSEIDVAFLNLPTAVHYRVAERAAKRGIHLFLEWPPATSIREGEAMVRLAEEAGVEMGVSRSLRFHPLRLALPEGWQPRLVMLHQTLSGETRPAWPRVLADAVDLCCALARSGSVHRVDAEAVHTGARPDAVAFGLRFHNGAYAQAALRLGGAAPGGTLYVAGPGHQYDANLAGTTLRHAAAPEHAAIAPFTSFAPPPTSPFEAETRAFLDALAERRPPPVSILDALHTMRLVERLMERLR